MPVRLHLSQKQRACMDDGRSGSSGRGACGGVGSSRPLITVNAHPVAPTIAACLASLSTPYCIPPQHDLELRLLSANRKACHIRDNIVTTPRVMGKPPSLSPLTTSANPYVIPYWAAVNQTIRCSGGLPLPAQHLPHLSGGNTTVFDLLGMSLSLPKRGDPGLQNEWARLASATW
ncbi:hypothetical protein LY76DRAFT_271432 [Colletotrichum caudatum]|nr:hypothetical protein LY76DRAFT_271432 [Colletotrichum caudatum]